ncbi:Protein Pet100 [Trinorchestia longiramus]|nr:Protein Pet100 [Trinorchestia longiramus]
MGMWKLEVGRMAIYMIFPVAAFYIFNQPQWFEESTIKEKKRIFKPTNKADAQMLEDCIKNLREKEEAEMLRLLNKSK